MNLPYLWRLIDLFWWIVKIALWALAGFIASNIMRSSLGVLWNIVLGLIGGVIGSFLAGLIGINAANTLGSIVISVLGSCLVIYLARIILPRIKH